MVIVTGECVGRFVDWRLTSPPKFLCEKEAWPFAKSEEVKNKGDFQRCEENGRVCNSPWGNRTEH